MPNVTRPPRQEWEIVADDTDRLKVPGGWLYRVIGGRQAMALCFVPDEEEGRKRGLAEQQETVDRLRRSRGVRTAAPDRSPVYVERAPTTPTWLASLEPPMPGPCPMVCTRRGGAVRGEAPRPQLHQHRSHAGAQVLNAQADVNLKFGPHISF